MILRYLDSVIAFFAIILAGSLAIIAGTQLLVSLFGLRGANLRRGLADLFESASDDADAKRYSKVIARRVLQQPLVSGSVWSRFGIRLSEIPYMPADAAGKLRWAGSGIPLQPWLLGAAAGCFLGPAGIYVIDRLFAVDFCAAASVVTSYLPFIDLCGHPWRSGALLGAVAGGLLSRWRLATSIRLEELVALLERLSAPAGGTLPDPAQRAMLVIAGETSGRARPKSNPVSAQIDRIFRETAEESEGGVAVAVEKSVTKISSPPEVRAEGLNLWFDHAMERASQRFTLQARAIAVSLAVIVVFAAHLDAIRLFQSLSADAQARAQLAASAEALSKQAEQLAHARDAQPTVVPDVYRSAMAAVLAPAAIQAPAVEPVKSKAHRSSRSAAPRPSAMETQQLTTTAAAPGDVQISSGNAQPSEAGAQTAPAVAQGAPDLGVKKHESKSAKQAKAKGVSAEREKAAAVEDSGTLAAKARAFRALEARTGFASREDAENWLHDTLEQNPATENLAVAYQQEVNAQLRSDADKLNDQAASIKRELTRTEFRLMPESTAGWQPRPRELPGLLIAIALLALGAPVCYNLLKAIASLRPLPKLK